MTILQSRNKPEPPLYNQSTSGITRFIIGPSRNTELHNLTALIIFQAFGRIKLLKQNLRSCDRSVQPWS